MRIDNHIVEKLWVSKNKAQMLIKDWKVTLSWKIIRKNGFAINDNDIKKIYIEESDIINYVSRSAIKLKTFLEQLYSNDFYRRNIIIDNAHCFDVWSSTWWFTQVLLEHNAKEVYSLDVWDSQLHESIKSNDRVMSIENTDIRTYKNIDKIKFSIITCDVSFISLTKVIDSILEIADDTAWIFLLYKPQFEVWKDKMKPNGTLKNEKDWLKQLEFFKELLLGEKKCRIKEIQESSLKGEKGNQEYMILLKKWWHQIIDQQLHYSWKNCSEIKYIERPLVM